LVSATNTLQYEKTEFQIQTEKQKAAVSDVIVISSVLVDFITDSNEFPTQEGKYDENSVIYKALYPYYMEDLPIFELLIKLFSFRSKFFANSF